MTRLLKLRLAQLLAAGLWVATATTVRATPIDDSPLATKRWPHASVITALAQGPDLMLWVGTVNGAERFDGHSFWPPPAALAQAVGEDAVRALAFDKEGALWMVTGALSWSRVGKNLESAKVFGRRRLLRFDVAGHVTNIDLHALHPSSLAAARDGKMWVGTDHGLVIVAGSQARQMPANKPEPIAALVADVDGSVWAGTTTGLLHFDETGATLQSWTELGGVQALVAREEGGVVAAGAAGVWDVKSQQAPRLIFSFGDFHGGETLAVALQRERLWLATVEGLACVDVKTGALLRDIGGVTSRPERPTTLFKDAQGTLWSTNREGQLLSRRTPLAVSRGIEHGMPGNTAFSVIATSSVDVWVSFNDALTRLSATSGVTSWLGGRTLPAHGPRQMVDLGGGKFIAVADRGLLGFRPALDSFVLERNQGWPPADVVGAALYSDQKQLWLGWASGSVDVLPNDDPNAAAQRRYTSVDGTCPGPVRLAAQSLDGAVWFNHTGDAEQVLLSRIANGAATCLRLANAARATPLVLAPVKGDAAAIWLGTTGARPLVYVAATRTKPLSFGSVSPATSVMGLASDKLGWTWMATDSGVLRMRESELLDLAAGRRDIDDCTAQIFNADDGMDAVETTGGFPPAIAIDGQGRAWVSTLQGVSVITPPEQHTTAPLRLQTISSFVNGVEQASKARAVKLVEGRDDLQVSFSAIALDDAHRIKLSHRLEGWETDFAPSPPDRTVRYRSLRAGQYAFVALAARDGSRQEQRLLQVEVLPPFYRRWPFVATLLSVLAFTSFLVHRGRLRILRRRHAAVLAERGRIARDLHDGLAQKFTAMGMVLDGMRLAETQNAHTAEGLSRARAILTETHEELRRSIWDLRRVNDSGDGLVDRLRAVVEDAKRAATSTKLSFASSHPFITCNADLAHEAPMIVQEAISNALRHANATQIAVEVLSDEDGISIFVRDNGVGFLPRAPFAIHTPQESGFGIISMHERARRTGARLQIDGHAGKGTQVALTVPHTARGNT